MQHSLLEDSKRYLTQGAKEAFNHWIQADRPAGPRYKFSKQKGFTKDREEYQHLSTIAMRAIPQLQSEDFKGVSQEEQDYTWMNVFWQTWL